ncbi:hypothetical protein pb186bvf_019641 [Paramecium bursaria]
MLIQLDYKLGEISLSKSQTVGLQILLLEQWQIEIILSYMKKFIDIIYIFKMSYFKLNWSSSNYDNKFLQFYYLSPL